MSSKQLFDIQSAITAIGQQMLIGKIWKGNMIFLRKEKVDILTDEKYFF